MYGQQALTLEGSSSKLEVFGTSNIHDWEITLDEMKGSGSATFEGSTLSDITAFTFSAPVTELKSGKSQMDKNTYKALQSDTYPKLNFRMSSIKGLTQSGSSYHFTATGTLTLAGKSQTIQFPVEGTQLADNKLQLKGKVSLDMTDYGIEPPTALFGSITTGPKVDIHFLTALKITPKTTR
jgi:polyisoprenoid-binding protein YceI